MYTHMCYERCNPQGRAQHEHVCGSVHVGNLGVQRAWSEIMNVLANPRGSVGHWNLNFWRLEQFYTNF
jgi:hypothetical protein